MNFKEFGRHLAGKDVAPVYVLQGGEEFYVSQALAQLRDKVLSGADPLLGESQLDGREKSPGEIFDEARTRPLMGQRRLVVVRQAQGLLKKPGPKKPSPLEQYLAAPAKVGVLALDVGEVDWRREKAIKAMVGRQGVVVDCVAPRAQGMAAWISSEARALGLTIKADAAALMAERIGADLDRAVSALWQAGTFRAGQAIRREDVDALVETDRAESVFDLPEAFAARDAGRALAILRGSEVESVEEMIPAVAWSLRRLVEARRLDRAGVGTGGLCRALRLSADRANRFVSLARRFGPGELEMKLRHLLDADVKVKTGRLGSRLALELLVLQLAREETGSRGNN